MKELMDLTRTVGELKGKVEQHMEQQTEINANLTAMLASQTEKIGAAAQIGKRAHERLDHRNLIHKVVLLTFVVTVVLLGGTQGDEIYSFVINLGKAASAAKSITP